MPKLLLTLLDGHNAKIRMLAVYTPASGCSSRTSASLPAPGGVQSGCSRVGNAIAWQRFLHVWNISHLIINVYNTWKYGLIQREEIQVQLAGCKTKWKVRYLLFRLSCILECSNLNLFSCVLWCEAQGEFHLHLFLLLSFASPADVLERRSDSLLPLLYPNRSLVLLVDGYIGGGPSALD
jgi:hypothetical protein